MLMELLFIIIINNIYTTLFCILFFLFIIRAHFVTGSGALEQANKQLNRIIIRTLLYLEPKLSFIIFYNCIS